MAEHKPLREQLMRRREEILEQLNRVNTEQRIELDRDPEEQAIQLEQDQVPVSMEENLRRELAVIEDQLLDMQVSEG
jgi:RNA polymerase-binding transcription factor DksA